MGPNPAQYTCWPDTHLPLSRKSLLTSLYGSVSGCPHHCLGLLLVVVLSLMCFILSVYVFCLHVQYCALSTQCPRRSEEHIRSPGTGIKVGFKLVSGCWKLSPGPLQGQPVLLMAVSLLQPDAHLGEIKKEYLWG